MRLARAAASADAANWATRCAASSLWACTNDAALLERQPLLPRGLTGKALTVMAAAAACSAAVASTSRWLRALRRGGTAPPAAAPETAAVSAASLAAEAPRGEPGNNAARGLASADSSSSSLKRRSATVVATSGAASASSSSTMWPAPTFSSPAVAARGASALQQSMSYTPPFVRGKRANKRSNRARGDVPDDHSESPPSKLPSRRTRTGASLASSSCESMCAYVRDSVRCRGVLQFSLRRLSPHRHAIGSDSPPTGQRVSHRRT